MATHTTNYNLSMPETTDSQQSFIDDYCENMEIIDQNMGGGGGGGGGHVIIDESGTEVAQEPNMQFTGKVEVTDDAVNEKTVVDVLPEVVEVTQAEYNALPDSKLSDNILYCIKDSVNGVDGYPPLIYSTDEREVGVWIDGKPLYQRVFDLGSDVVIYPDSLTNTFIDASQMQTLVDAWGIYSTGITKYSLMANKNNNIIRLQTDRNGASASIRYVVMSYTKTTDVAGSGTWNGQGGLAHHYSTNETVIGTWIDGKPLYEKTFNATLNNIASGVATNVEDVSGLSIDEIANISGRVNYYNGANWFYVNLGTYFGAYIYTNGYLQFLQTMTGQTTNRIYKIAITVRYTKTTD